jgi:hypothetical protein
MERRDLILQSLAKAGAQGLTEAALAKCLHVSAKKIPALLQPLKLDGALHGPFKTGRSKRYFAGEHAPTREKVAAQIEEWLRDAGLNLTSFSKLEGLIKGAAKSFLLDALSALKADGKIVELRDPRKSKLYLHREPLLEQLRTQVEIRERGPASDNLAVAISLEQIRPVYQALKAQQGGISAVTIFDVLKGVGASKEELHRLLLREAKRGRVTLHPSSTTNFNREVVDAGIKLEGQPYPFVTMVLKEGT